MIAAPHPGNDKERLHALNSYQILDTQPDTDFDDITYIASQICGTPISLVSLIDNDRQWFKSRHGMKASETHRDFSFCSHAILNPKEIFEIPDSTQDLRFIDNPLVVEEPKVIFYAGVPLVTPEGFALGTLCVIDNAPKHLDEFQRKALRALANQVVHLLELRKKVSQLDKKKVELQHINEQLERFAQVASHDLKAPLVRIQAVTDLLKEFYIDKLDADGKKCIDILSTSSIQLIKMVEGILLYSKTTAGIGENVETFDLTMLIDEVLSIIDLPFGSKVNYSKMHIYIATNRVALMQILLNLCSNAVRYNNKEHVELTLGFNETNEEYVFEVTDNGPGIEPQKFEKIFDLFYTLDQGNQTIRSGTGIGLATVKNLIEHLGGKISISSVLNEYTTFKFTVLK